MARTIPSGWKGQLCCPECHGSLHHENGTYSCGNCGRSYPTRDGKVYFREVDAAEISDSMDRVKFFFKRFPRLYYLLIDLFSPVLVRRDHHKLVLGGGDLVINLGSGNSHIHDGVLNLDMTDYRRVHVVTDIHRLPFPDDSVDGVFDIAVLEHVENPVAIVAEIHRVLKPGGWVFSVIPFMQPFHASPHDYQRYTGPGINYLHRDFERIDSGAYNGPASSFVWVTQEFLALLLSFGWRPLRNLLSLVFMLILWPLKFLDLFLQRLDTAENMASTFFFHGRK